MGWDAWMDGVYTANLDCELAIWFYEYTWYTVRSTHTHNDLIESLKSDSKIDVDDADAEADEGDGSGTIDIIQLHRSQNCHFNRIPVCGVSQQQMM